jgi:formiminotetrahydrofolate cyclodeaminase
MKLQSEIGVYFSPLVVAVLRGKKEKTNYEKERKSTLERLRGCG